MESLDFSSLRLRYTREGPSTELAASFNEMLYAYFAEHARVLPWRTNPSPYNVFISEVMLQQTQVSRVIVKFSEFIVLFPDFPSLAAAPLDRLLAAWSGLGYNRRALMLKKAAEVICSHHAGVLPADRTMLEKLSGIGSATAASIAAFAFNVPTECIETNIRAVLIHIFFPYENAVSDVDLRPFLIVLLDRREPRKWYFAMMDLYRRKLTFG